jgi:hypothetical protein
VVRFDSRIRKTRKRKIDTVVHFAAPINGHIDLRCRKRALQTTADASKSFLCGCLDRDHLRTRAIIAGKRDCASDESQLPAARVSSSEAELSRQGVLHDGYVLATRLPATISALGPGGFSC